MADGKVKGYFVMGENPVGGLDERRAPARGPAQAGLAGGARLRHDRDGRVLAHRARGRARRHPRRGHRDRGLLLPGRRAHREGRQLHQHAAPAAVAPQGGRAAGRLPQRTALHLRAGPAAQAALRGLDDCEGPADPRPHLGLPRGEATTSPTPRPCCAEINGYTVVDGKPVEGFTQLEGRRLAPRAAAGSTPAATRTA